MKTDLTSIFETLPQLLSPVEAAKILGISPLTLANRRSKKLPPSYVIFGRRVRYTKTDMMAYLESITICPEVEVSEQK